MDSTDKIARVLFGLAGLVLIFAAPIIWDLWGYSAGITSGCVGVYFTTIALKVGAS